MKFEDVHGRCQARRLSQAEAAEILGMSARTFRRWRGPLRRRRASGLLDRRLGKVSARRVPVDQVNQVLTLYRERYGGFTARHLHDKLCRHHVQRHDPRGRALAIDPGQALRQELDQDYEATVGLDATHPKAAPAKKIPSSSRT